MLRGSSNGQASRLTVASNRTSGSPAVGDILTATLPAGTVASSYQWVRDTGSGPTAISGATSSTYTLVSADIPPSSTTYKIYPMAVISSIFGDYTITSPPPGPYAKTKTALTAVAAGTGYARFGLLGDSTVAGAHGASGGATLRSSVPVTFFRDQLNSVQSSPAIASSWVGDQRFGFTNSITPYTFDTRFSQPDGAGSSFSYTTNSPVSAGGGLLFNSANTNRLGFLPEIATDTTDTYYAKNTGLGSFTLARTGTATSASISQNAAAGVGKATYVSTLDSVDPIYIAPVSGGVYIIGQDSWNSAIKSIRLFGIGWSGGRAADFGNNVNGFAPLPALVSLNLDLVVARFGTNDISIPGATTTSTDPVAYKTSISSIVDTLIAAGTNVVLATHYPMNISVSSQALQDQYAQIVRDVATARNLTVHDTYARVGTWVASNAAGKMFDNLHPNTSGYQDDAVALTSLVLSLS